MTLVVTIMLRPTHICSVKSDGVTGSLNTHGDRRDESDSARCRIATRRSTDTLHGTVNASHRKACTADNVLTRESTEDSICCTRKPDECCENPMSSICYPRKPDDEYSGSAARKRGVYCNSANAGPLWVVSRIAGAILCNVPPRA